MHTTFFTILWKSARKKQEVINNPVNKNKSHCLSVAFIFSGINIDAQ